MEYVKGIRCPICGYIGTEQELFGGCPKCRERGINVNFSTYYEYPDKEALRKRFPTEQGPGIWRHRAFLPVDSEQKPVSVAEGNTPLIHAERLGKELGLENLYLKLELQNTTWSHKDRLSSVGATRARQVGATALTVSSSGNHGAAVAAYAAAAGLPCFVFTTPSVPETMKTLMRSYGAYVFATESSLDRWVIMRWGVENLGWHPLSGYVWPPIGSNAYAVDGYKTLAFELFEQLGDLPETIVTPSGYSDLMYGMWKGIQDLNEVGLTDRKSRIFASEIWGSLTKAMEENAPVPGEVPDGPSVSFSIAVPCNTWQGLEPIRASGGEAVMSPDEDTMAMQLLLAKCEGVYAESSSVTSLVACKKLVEQGKLRPDEKVVAIVTSTGLKDPETTARYLADVPVIEPNYQSLSAALEKCYGKKV